MNGVKRILLACVALVAACLALAQPEVVKWSVAPVESDTRAGEAVTLGVTATIKPGWHIYDLKKKGGDWVPTEIAVAPGGGLAAAGDPVQPAPLTKYDQGFKTEIAYFENAVTVGLPAKVSASGASATGSVAITFQACDAKSCLSPTDISIPVTLNLASGSTRPERVAPSASVPPQPAGYATPSAAAPVPASVDAEATRINTAKKQGLVPFILLSFGAGLLALLTPCVWPMVPVTVSYFSKRTGSSALQGALWYCLGIMGTFVALGLITSAVFGASNIQAFAANPWVNLGLGLLFVVLAANLFGAFEIIVPSTVVGKAQEKTRLGGAIGPLSMGLVFSLTSFTCTVPFVGTLLVTASQGDFLYPVVGMLAFSAAFALPFFLLALFPSALSKLPKSGAWLVDVKAYMGLLELAAALKFFSNFEVTIGSQPLGFLPKEVFLAVWGAIFIMASLFLFGLVRFPHSEPSKPGGFRLFFAVLNVGVAVWLLGALAGKAQLGSLVGFLPPYSVGTAKQSLAYHDSIEPALSEAKQKGSLVFVNFTGVTCTNCRVMEQNVLPDPQVTSALKGFARAELYTDRPTPADRANAKLREELTKSVTNPVYVVMTADKKVVSVMQGASDVAAFTKFLDDAARSGR